MHTRNRWIVLAGLALAGVGTLGAAPDVDKTLAEAQRLEDDGKAREAFMLYLSVPGCGHAAAAVGRGRAAELLDLLRAAQAELPPQVKLVEGDLLIALERKAEALTAYRAASAAWAGADDYPVDPPTGDSAVARYTDNARRPLTAFTVGPGSHRDNWLIRRFIALEAWDDAAREFERMRALHRKRTQPYVAAALVLEEGGPLAKKRLFKPVGYDGLGLQFALDHAFFLKKQGRAAEHAAVLLEPLRAMDLDRDPNVAGAGEPIEEADAARYAASAGAPFRRGPSWWGSFPAGTTRKEYVRLAYGALKTAGHEDALVADLERGIGAGTNRLRRVLARVRLHQSRPEDALDLDLEYIRAGGFDALTSVFRRGLAFEDARKPAEAAAEYEKALALPYTPPALPDRDEEEAQSTAMVRQIPFSPRDPDPSAQRRAFRDEVCDRLQRQYTALGQTAKVTALALARLDLDDPDAGRASRGVADAARRFRAEGREAEFQAWARERLGKDPPPPMRLALLWELGEYDRAALAVAASVTPRDRYATEAWKDRYTALGREPLRSLLKALVAAAPADAQSRLELLDLEERLDGPEAIAALETLLDGDAEKAFPWGKGARNRTRFRNCHDLAFRLARLYERHGPLDALHALALRVAGCQKPFAIRSLEDYRYRDRNDVPEFAEACLALAIHHADTAERQEALAAALANSPWAAARAQLARRRAATAARPDPTPEPPPWANLPTGVTALASGENALCVARDDQRLYAGFPWGLAVLDFEGRLVTRVALGEAVRALVATNGVVWAGTPKGMFRIARGTWAVAHQPLELDVPPRDRHARTSSGPAEYWFDNGVYALALDRERLWIGLHRNVQALNVETLELRAYSYEELKVQGWCGFERFLVERDHVWANSPHAGLRRYDRATDTWTAVTGPPKAGPVRLIGRVDGILWGSVYLNNELRARPCRIETATAVATPVAIEGNLSESERCINGPFSYAGKLDDRPTFVPDDYRLFAYDAASDRLRSVREGLPEATSRLTDRPEPGVVLPDGARVSAERGNRTRYEYPREDEAEARRPGEPGGGLRFAPSGKPGAVRAAFGDSLPGDAVLGVIPDAAREEVWLVASHGAAVLDGAGRLKARYDRSNGLISDCVAAGVATPERVFLAAGWGDSGGGLAVFNRDTRVFTWRLQSDGLATDKLAGLGLEGGKLRLTYGVEYLRYQNGNSRMHPPGLLDLATGGVAAGGEPRPVSQGESRQLTHARDLAVMPVLGGFVLGTVSRDGRRYVHGTRGLLIADERAPLELAFAPLGARLVSSQRQTWLAEVRMRPVKFATLDQAREALRDPNPFYRANVLATAWFGPTHPDALDAAAAMLGDAEPRVRCTALFQVARMGGADTAVLPLLEARLKDEDPYIRAVAALALASHGRLADLVHYRAILDGGDRFGNFPFGAESSVGVRAGRQQAYEALAPLATPEVLGLLLEFPPSWEAHDPTKVFPPLGEALRRHPGAAGLLLQTADASRHSTVRRDFVRRVFAAAGADMLPALHEALTSSNRVVRSNAARACGTLRDPASVGPLIKALDLESGLSRASIVWALGELSATNALPRLVDLYTDAANDEQRRRGGGFRSQQMAAVMQAEFQSIRKLDSIAGDWSELTASVRPRGHDPREAEELLAPAHILEAVRRIGPAAAQAFYRALASGRDAEVRAEAAAALGEGKVADSEANLPILRQLLADPSPHVKVAAAVSLLLLGELAPRGDVLQWLNGPDVGERALALRQLARVKDPARLEFARAAIERIAKDPATRETLAEYARTLLQRFPAR
jgi:HEAT repeat protein